VETLDCPELCGLRETRDVLDSHRSAGRFDPALWWMVRREGKPAGALLLNPSPAQGHVELVYLGLAPELRGCGVARRLMLTGLSALAGRAERDVTLAVDTRNTPALRLYESLGFRPFARRTALVRPIV
jgi:mycothiol synthase